MTRSNAAHEPSMDEILASIRRIIESGDERPEPAATSRLRPERAPHVERLGAFDANAANVVARLTPEPAPDRPVEDRALDAMPIGNPVPTEAAEEDDVAGGTADLADEAPEPESAGIDDLAFGLGDEDDLAARLRDEFAAEDLIDWSALTAALSDETAESTADLPRMGILAVELPTADRPGDYVQQPEESAEARSEPIPAAIAMPLQETAPSLPTAAEAEEAASIPAAPIFPAASAAPASPVAPDGDAPAAASSEEDAGTESPFVAANSDSRRMQEFRAAVLDDAVDKHQPDGASLMSGRTGELVGASFDELAEAIREGQLRSMEEMAQDLLRPMLQDWLDENLPKLVERLVREEIERVARGGRR